MALLIHCLNSDIVFGEKNTHSFVMGAVPTVSKILKGDLFSKYCFFILLSQWSRSIFWKRSKIPQDSSLFLQCTCNVCWLMAPRHWGSPCVRSQKLQFAACDIAPKQVCFSVPLKSWNLALSWPPSGWKCFQAFIFRIGGLPHVEDLLWQVIFLKASLSRLSKIIFNWFISALRDSSLTFTLYNE